MLLSEVTIGSDTPPCAIFCLYRMRPARLVKLIITMTPFSLYLTGIRRHVCCSPPLWFHASLTHNHNHKALIFLHFNPCLLFAVCPLPKCKNIQASDQKGYKYDILPVLSKHFQHIRQPVSSQFPDPSTIWFFATTLGR
jgi:hypothetical protein